MKRLLQACAVSALFLGCAGSAGAQISFGIQIGPPPQPRAYKVPAMPARDYEWVEGYWYLQGNKYLWHNGYWTRPPYEGAYWVAPYYLDGRYVAGQWEGGRGAIPHDHRWDKSRQRDERRTPPPPPQRGRDDDRRRP
jgi:hypothetical protein